MAEQAGEPQYLYLTTTGWRSGRPHEIEIWFVGYQGRYYLRAERGEAAHWVRNLRHNPRVRFRVGEATYTGSARVVDAAAEPELARAIQALSVAKYGWGGGLPVELSPEEAG